MKNSNKKEDKKEDKKTNQNYGFNSDGFENNYNKYSYDSYSKYNKGFGSSNDVAIAFDLCFKLSSY